MPTVPRYEPSTSLRPLQQQTFNVRASAEDFGAAAARGLGDVASGLSKVAQAKIAIEELEGEAAAKQRDNRYSAWAREAMYGEGGYMTLEGQAAVAARAEFEKQAAAKREEFGQGLTGFGAQAYSRASEARLNSILDQTIVHQASERKTWFKEASTDRINTFAEDALAGFNNPAIVNKNIAAGQAELRSVAALSGWDADTLKARESEFVSGIHKNVALRLAQTDPLAAQAYYESKKDQFSGSDATDLEGVLAPVVIDQKARQEADRILGTGRGTSADAGSNAPADALGNRGPTRAYAVLTERAVGGATRPDAIANLDANFATNLAALIEDAPPGIKEGLGLTSGYRSTERQAELFENSDGSGKMVAPPGSSSHEFGMAADLTYNGKTIKPGEVPQEVIDYLHDNAAAYGLNFRMSWEPWHIEPTNAREVIASGGATVSARGTGVSPRASGPSLVEQQQALDAIADPRLREETARRLKIIADLRDADAKAQFDRLKADAFAMIDQGQSPDSMDPQVRAALGREEMSGLWSYYEARTKGNLKTDERTLFDLQSLYASDPDKFASYDIWSVRDRLSDADWEKVNGWRQTALQDKVKARDEANSIISTSEYMKTQLEAAGITATGKDGVEREAAMRREAQFQIRLQQEVERFAKENNKQPGPTDIQSMVNRLLLPVVISEPGLFWDSKTPGRLFEVPKLGGIGGGRTAAIFQDYAEIPQADRIQIEVALEATLGYKPSEEQVEAEYARYLNSAISTGQ